MTCEKNKELMLKYIEGTLSETELLKLSEHIKNCPDCEEEFLAYCQVYDELQDFNSNPEESSFITDDFEDNIMKKISGIEFKTEKILICIMGVTALFGAVLLLLDVDKSIIFGDKDFVRGVMQSSISFVDKTVAFIGFNIGAFLRFIHEYLLLLKPFSLIGIVFAALIRLIYIFFHRGEKNEN